VGHGLTGTSGTTIAINGVNVPSLVGFPAGDAQPGLGWFDDDDIVCQVNFGGGFHLYRTKISTDTPTLIDALGATQLAAGNGVWAAYLSGIGVRSNVFTSLPLAGFGDTSPEGITAVVQSFSTGTGFVVLSSSGSVLYTSSAALAGGSEIRVKGGIVAYRDAGGTHLRSSTGVLQPYAPRTETVYQCIPITVAGAQWVVEVTGAVTSTLVVRPATSSNGFILNTGDAFNVDAVEVSAGVLRVGWCINAGETNTSLRLADLTISTSALSTGTTSSGSLVITAQPNATPSIFPVGPIEGGSLSANKQPRQQPVTDPNTGIGTRVYQKWWDQIAGQAFAPPNLSQATGIIDPAHGGTGTTTGLTVLNGANIIDGSLPITAIEDQPESTLLGRGQGSGAGPVQDITLGAGLSMTGTVLDTASGGTQYMPVFVGGLAMSVGAALVVTPWTPPSH
jgi:hypothetical protein